MGSRLVGRGAEVAALRRAVDGAAQIVDPVAAGLSNADIAVRLYLSERTVES